MHRIFIDQEALKGDGGCLRVLGAEAHHMKNVLRMRPGDVFIACDGAHTDYTCTVVDLTKDSLTATITSASQNASKKNYTLTLCQAMPKGAKIDTVLQKATEIGADAINIFFSARTDVRYDETQQQKRLIRYNRIVEEAAKQCGAGSLPAVRIYKDFDGLLRALNPKAHIILAYEEEKTTTFKSVLRGDSSAEIVFIIGPEGGFAPEEVHRAKEAGADIVSLGKRILRTETAGMFMLACCVYEKQEEDSRP